MNRILILILLLFTTSVFGARNKYFDEDTYNFGGTGTITKAELYYLQGLTGNIQTQIDGKVSDTAYNATSWDGVTAIAPSKNAVRDQVEAMLTSMTALISDTAYNGTSWDGVTSIAPSKNAVRDQVEALITSIATKQSLLTNSAGLAGALSDETGTGFAVFSASPALTGSPTVPTQTAGDNSTKAASTAYVATAITNDDANDAHITGNETIAGEKTFSGSMIYSGATNDAAATGANATITSTAGMVTRLTNASLTSIGAFGATTAGRRVVLINSTGASVTVQNNNGSTAAQGILTGTGADITLANGAAVEMIYNSTLARWEIIGGSGGGATIKAQLDASATAVSEIQVPAYQSTNTASGKYKIETGNLNLLKNPNFDQLATSCVVTSGSSTCQNWTITQTGTATCTFTQEQTGAISGEVNFGKLSATGGASGGTCSIKQSATTTSGQQALIRARFYPDPLGNCLGPSVVYRTLVNGSAVTTQTITNCGVTNYWTEPMGVSEISGTTTGLESVITLGASTTTYIGIDQAYVALGDVTASIGGIGSQTYGATVSSTNTISSVLYSSTANLFSVSSVSSRVRFTALRPITFIGDASRANSAVAPTSCQIIWWVNGTQVSYEQQFSSTGGSQEQSCTGGANATLNTGEYIEFAGAIYSGGVYSSAFVTATAIDNSLTKMFASSCGANCENVFAGSVTSGAAVTAPYAFMTASTPGTGRLAITLNTSIFTVRPVCVVTGYGTNTISTQMTQDDSHLTWTGTFTFDVTSGIENGANNALRATDVGIVCVKQGVDYINSRLIAGSFKETPKTIGTSGSDIQKVFFGSGASCTSACTTGTCTICKQVGSKITSVTWASQGNYNINGLDGTKYTCSGTGYSGGHHAIIHIPGVSTTLTQVEVGTSAATAGVNTAYNDVTCMGIP